MKPAPRALTRFDRDAAKAYAAKHPSDPFSYARALSRLANGLCSADDLQGGASI